MSPSPHTIQTNLEYKFKEFTKYSKDLKRIETNL